MVLRIGDKVKAEKAWSMALENRAIAAGSPKTRKARSQKWNTLREKLLALVRMRASWGELHDIVRAHARIRVLLYASCQLIRICSNHRIE